MIDESVLQAIREHSSDSPSEIRVYVEETFGVKVPPTLILRELNDRRRNRNVGASQLKASERLAEKIDLSEDLIAMYQGNINDGSVALKDKLMAMRDLRQWVKMAMDAAGESTESSDKLFVIGEEWDLGTGPREVN